MARLEESKPMSWQTPLFSFKGRVRRRHWWFVVAATMLVLGLADAVTPEYPPLWVVVWALAVQVVLVWMFLAVSAKRWHDIGKSGWWTLIHLLPGLGTLVAAICNGCLGGDVQPNRFGNPLSNDAEGSMAGAGDRTQDGYASGSEG